MKRVREREGGGEKTNKIHLYRLTSVGAKSGRWRYLTITLGSSLTIIKKFAVNIFESFKNFFNFNYVQ